MYTNYTLLFLFRYDLFMEGLSFLKVFLWSFSWNWRDIFDGLLPVTYITLNFSEARLLRLRLFMFCSCTLGN